MVRHTVVFTLHDKASAKDFFAAAKQLANIPGVQNFECLKQLSKKNGFEYGLSMEFASQAFFDEYTNHPAHVDFVERVWLKNVSNFMEIDYTPM